MAATTSSPFELSKTSLCATSTVFARFLGARQRSKPMMCECAKLDLSSAKFPFLEPPPPVRTPYCAPLLESLADGGHEGGQHRNRTANHHGNFYNILLISDDRHNEVLVEKALPEIFPSLTTTDAKTLFWKSEENCYAIIFVTQSKELAEIYVRRMMSWGLHAAMEPQLFIQAK
ncbi:hypothetical protein OPV22_009922 [Ensete ventricosum]|uniref:Uncharacterized protein n=1 Tax=Ensete ventricosum TaxID=4639 RepID=A0AAV8Q113_ENSVE|nr:hypothetical protein OPV22_009922 [Ensete ventricosum]